MFPVSNSLGPPILKQRMVATLATRLFSSSSSVVKNIRARMKEKETSINPRVASGSAKDCCMGFGWGKAHGPSSSMVIQVTAIRGEQVLVRSGSSTFLTVSLGHLCMVFMNCDGIFSQPSLNLLLPSVTHNTEPTTCPEISPRCLFEKVPLCREPEWD